MEQDKETSSNEDNASFEEEISKLIQEQLLFTESIYNRLPISIEVYDANGVLRSINDHALHMYGVEDRNTVVNFVNLFKSPYVDDQLRAKIQSGKEIVRLEFEYDFERIKNNAYFSTKNQDTMIYDVRIIPILSKNGAVIGHILLSNDVTAIKDAEFHTEETKKDLELAMNTANMSSWVYDVHKKVFEPLYGDTVIKGTTPIEELLLILHPQDHQLLMQSLTLLINKKIEQQQITVRFYNAQEQQYRYYESMMRLSTEHWGKLQVVGTQLDVTEKVRMAKKTQDLIAKRELTMKVSNIVHWDFDVKTQKFESYNDPINDYTSNRLLTLSEYLDVIHPEDRTSFSDAIAPMLEGKDLTVYFTCRMQTKYDKSWQYCDFTAVPFEKDENGNITHFTGFRQNIPQLQKLNREQQEMIKELKEKAELSDRLKSAFLANMSHEIRTPLNAIVGFSELMTSCNDPEEKNMYINIIKSNNELLLRLINDILDLSKIEAGILERKIERFNLATVSDELYACVLPKITNPGVKLCQDKAEANCWVTLDRNRLIQVWMNFLTNAIKYTKSGHIKMGYSVEGNGVRIYVEDTGIGIPQESHDKVFARFEKINEFVQGTGLGLAISKAIVETAGGSISFSSTPGTGSTFWAWVPCETNIQEE
ncbi:ATP-binding protein [Parabacteroides sp. AF17-28]|jgi:signal transduction histidine kinase|uniref:ATP-binding protein n=1 Tax=Parabacteroides sp. AF17-28 TaxID=2292241 RepID=UPI000F009C5C|nr:ATP-binding protein [Parabacteroides sp. AF17-28]RHR58937.1 PAS domain-containing protein [Parabacteroides sp. AF17-28]